MQTNELPNVSPGDLRVEGVAGTGTRSTSAERSIIAIGYAALHPPIGPIRGGRPRRLIGGYGGGVAAVTDGTKVVAGGLRCG
ncbi:hypothetical protein B8W66_05700 [Mycobacterium decipiens]|uniref:Uncharacterized protein n=1 Tax=Mycobacterium decipiens TaxID=1430326 RepID=A0A1X2LXS6_9MYCO|nr:hypothetical protein B8W66_05700 [Mycobacterium decipiens]